MPAKSSQNPVEKALWFIESHFQQEIDLAAAAEIAGVSRYHLSRAFGLAIGRPFQRYLRGRRLTEAARLLAQGAPDILQVAGEMGYGSHEAFTRAFRDEFAQTPEEIRKHGSLAGIKLLEPIKMDESQLTNLEPPRFKNRGPLLIAGLCERYNSQSSAAIPAQWQRFGPYLGHIPGQIRRDAYGVISNGDDAGCMDYTAGVEVADFARVPPELEQLTLPPQRYAVFTHRGHISTIRRVWMTIFNKAIPEAGIKMAEAPQFEWYGEKFDPLTGNGGFEIWIPILA